MKSAKYYSRFFSNTAPDPDASRVQRVSIWVNQMELEDIAFAAARDRLALSSYVRRRLGLSVLRRGAPNGNRNRCGGGPTPRQRPAKRLGNAPPAPPQPLDLSTRAEILLLHAQGVEIEQVAAQLAVSVASVQQHWQGSTSELGTELARELKRLTEAAPPTQGLWSELRQAPHYTGNAEDIATIARLLARLVLRNPPSLPLG